MKIVTTLLAGLLSLLLFGCGDSGYEKRNGVWHYDGIALHRITQPDQFKPLLGPFAKGADAGYFRGASIMDSDGPSFEALDEHYARDKSRAYYCDTYRKGQEYYTTKHDRIVVLEGVEPASFRLLKERYARDAGKLFFEGVPVAVKDLNSFEILEHAFQRDRVTGYYVRTPIPGSDGSTFTVLDSNYSKDKSSVFYSSNDPDAGPAARMTIRVTGALPASFVAKEAGYAADANQVYHQGKVLTKNVAGFQVQQYGYARSSNAVYYEGKPIAGADAATFATIERRDEQADARDAQASYLEGKRVPAGQVKATGA